MNTILKYFLLSIFLSISLLSTANQTDSIFKSIMSEADTINESREKSLFLSTKIVKAIIDKNDDLVDKIDSALKTEAIYGKEIILYSNLILKKGFAYLKVKDSVNAQKYYLQLLDLYNNTEDKISRFYAGTNVASFHYSNDQLDSLRFYLDILSTEAVKINPKVLSEKNLIYYNKLMAELYRYYYMYYQKYNILDKATDNIIKSHSYNVLNRDVHSIISDYKRIASLLYRTGKYDEAKHYYKKQLKLAIEQELYNDTYTSALTGLGAIYISEEKYDSAQIMFNNALEAHKQLKNTHQFNAGSVAGVLMNLGIVYKNLGKYDKALKYYHDALELAGQYSFTNSFYIKQMAKLNLATLFYKTGEDEKAIEYSLSVINEKDKRYSRFNIKAFENLTIIYEGRKDYQKALEYHKKYTAYKDSITSENIETKIESLELSLENERIKTENALLEKEKEVNEVKRERQKQVNILTFVITFIFLTAAFVILMINIKKRRAEKELFIKTEESNKNEILSLMKAQEMNSMTSYMSGQEEERKRIASDLHDRLGSLFSTVKLYFSGLQSKFKDADESTKKTFKTIITLVDQSVDEVRSVSHNLAKDIVVQFGLIKAIKDIELAVNSSAKMHMKVIDNNFRFIFDKDSEMSIYKALQEMITNAIRHSRAKNIIVQFTSINENEANIIVEDDGIGIDKRKVQGGLGMKNIHDRLNAIGADYNIDSSPESGTTFIINIKKQ